MINPRASRLLYSLMYGQDTVFGYKKRSLTAIDSNMTLELIQIPALEFLYCWYCKYGYVQFVSVSRCLVHFVHITNNA